MLKCTSNRMGSCLLLLSMKNDFTMNTSKENNDQPLASRTDGDNYKQVERGHENF